jgi:hypothetical protein
LRGIEAASRISCKNRRQSPCVFGRNSLRLPLFPQLVHLCPNRKSGQGNQQDQVKVQGSLSFVVGIAGKIFSLQPAANDRIPPLS